MTPQQVPDNSTPHDTSARDRVAKALRFEKPDRTPRDFAAVPEIWQKLAEHFGEQDRGAILWRLGVDCRIVSYDSFCCNPHLPEDPVDMNASLERSSTGGMWRMREADGTNRDIWGAHRRPVKNAFGALDEFASFPLGNAQSVDQLRNHAWPEPSWWDFSSLREVIGTLNKSAIYSIRFRVGSVFETAWSLRGFEQMLADLGSAPEIAVYIMERIAEVHCENLRRALSIAGDLIDVVYFYDDLASQTGLLLSPAMYKRFIQPLHCRLIDIARSAGKPVMLHSCGSIRPLIPVLIDAGVSILNPIQPKARGMEPERLAADFGGKIAFHGGVDVQGLLPEGSPAQVEAEVARISEILGASGGYIRAGSHHIQADTPVENVLAMFSV